MFSILILTSTFVAFTAGQTCSAPQGPCASTTVSGTTVYYCATGQACLADSTCCNYADIVTDATTTTTAAAATTTTAAATTTTAACVDKINPATGVSDCPKNAYLCDNPVYYQLMTEQCPKTCNRCGSSSVTTTASSATTTAACVDKVNPSTGVSDCPANANLCNVAAYKALMKDQCPKTCGYC